MCTYVGVYVYLGGSLSACIHACRERRDTRVQEYKREKERQRSLKRELERTCYTRRNLARI